jgi:hybrid cluster-associated redox disulfide protein
MNYTVNRDTLIGEILNTDPKAAPFFLYMGMHCLGCPSSTGESLEQACLVHGVPVQELITALNNHFESYASK